MQLSTMWRHGNRASLSKPSCSRILRPKHIALLGRRSSRAVPQVSVGAATLLAVHDKATEADMKNSMERSDDVMSSWETAVLSERSTSSESGSEPSQTPLRGDQNGGKLEDGFINGGMPEQATESRLQVMPCHQNQKCQQFLQKGG